MKIKRVVILDIIICMIVLLYSIFNASQQFDFKLASNFSGILILGLSFLIIVIITHYLFKFLKDLLVNKNKKKLKLFIIFLLYFIYLFLIMLLINKYFGITGQNIHSDMLTIIARLKQFQFLNYQGWYSSIFYFVGFSLFYNSLSNYAIVLFQILISSLFFIYVYSFFEKNQKKIYKIIWFIANLIFPAAFYNQFCLRQLWFAQIVIILAIQILSLKQTTDENKKYIKIIFLTALASILRPEAIIYVPFVLLFVFILNKVISIKWKFIYSFLMILVVFFINIPQKDDNEYKSTAILNPLSYLISFDDLNWGGENAKNEGIKIIDKVFDYNSLKKNSSYTGLNFIYKDPAAWHRNFSKQDFNNLLKLYIKLIIRNPLKWLKGRWLTFSTSFSNKGKMSYQLFFEKFINNNMVDAIIHFIYSPLLFLIINLIAVFYFIFIKKNQTLFVISTFGILETIMLFIFGTSSMYMFIYPIWLISLFITILLIENVFSKKEGRKNEKVF